MVLRLLLRPAQRRSRDADLTETAIGGSCMKVLGISPLDKDSTVSIVEDGRILYAAGEERFTRTKLQDGFPSESLEAALAFTGLKPQDIDVVAYPFLTWQQETKLFEKNLSSETEFLKTFEDSEL